MTSRQRVVFVGDSGSVFVSRTRDKLEEKAVSVSVIDPYVGTKAVGGIFAKLLRMSHRFKVVLKATKHQHSHQTAIVHYISLDCFWLIPLLSFRFDRVIAIAYGSDVLRRVKRRDWLLSFGLKRLDEIAATNSNVLDSLLADFPFLLKSKPQIIRFGLPVFDSLDAVGNLSPQAARASLGFAAEKQLVCLGYSASAGQQQLQLIEFFAKHANDLNQTQFVIPVQYGDIKIRKQVEASCAAINARLGAEQFHALTDFHDPQISAVMRRATDVLINHSISDAFSATVQEVVYAGNLVLAAEHLPYRSMPGFGSAILSYKSLEEALERLRPKALIAWQESAATSTEKNKECLYSTSSWAAVMEDWQEMINGQLK